MRRDSLRPRARWCILIGSVLWCAAFPLHSSAQDAEDPPRTRIGVAFGGGSARGLAHVGVVRWFEEHHVPIDLVAGTSMGGLIGGAFASGMSADELAALLKNTDWDEMFGFSPFRFKNIRRKEDARAYPSRLEFGFKQGIRLPLALNSGQQVDFLLSRIAGPYLTLSSFDELPTPFRAVAVDLVRARQVILDRGSLAAAMRATMSLPGIFPPVERDGQVLVDGGAMNNVPADVVRAMGADVVIAVNVGYMGDTREVSRSIFGLMGGTVDVMMQASTRASMKEADIVLNPQLAGFQSLDWRRSAELEAEGYRAAEALKDTLLPLAVSDSEWAAYQAGRQSRRKVAWPTPEFVAIDGAVPSDRSRMETVLAARVGQPLDVDALEIDLETFAGLDRYETVGWRLDEVGGRTGLRVDAHPKIHAPPFMMLGINLRNTTSQDFTFQLAGRYLTFDLLTSGTELRVDGAVGAEPDIGAELYWPIRSTPVFFTAAAGARRRTLNFVRDDVVAARYDETRSAVALGGGVNLGRDSDVRLSISAGGLNASVEAGDPQLPELDGMETRARLLWRYDGQDSPVVPSQGVRAVATIDHVFGSPGPTGDISTERSNEGITQVELRTSVFWSLRERHRAFVFGGAGGTFGDPLANEQFAFGAPMRLGALNAGEIRGDHYAVLTAGYLRGFARLPDFLGGSIFLGGWLENGSAFDDIEDATLRTNVSAGVLADTLVGPVLIGASFDVDGAWRYYVGVGRLF